LDSFIPSFYNTHNTVEANQQTLSESQCPKKKQQTSNKPTRHVKAASGLSVDPLTRAQLFNHVFKFALKQMEVKTYPLPGEEDGQPEGQKYPHVPHYSSVLIENRVVASEMSKIMFPPSFS